MFNKNITVFDHFLKDPRLLRAKIPVGKLTKSKLVSLLESSDAWAAKAVIFACRYLPILDKDKDFFQGIILHYETHGFLSKQQLHYTVSALRRYHDNIWKYLNLMEDWGAYE